MRAIVVIVAVIAGIVLAPFAPFHAGAFVVVTAGGIGLLVASTI